MTTSSLPSHQSATQAARNGVPSSSMDDGAPCGQFRSLKRRIANQEEGGKSFSCTACGYQLEPTGQHGRAWTWHPVLDVPVCSSCHDTYHRGDFTVGQDEKEAYCRWCGDGGLLWCCDLCPTAFCEKCIIFNFGRRELTRVMGVNDSWTCYVCIPSGLKELKRKNRATWGESPKDIKAKAHRDSKLLLVDVSNGRERIPIPVWNEVDHVGFDDPFVYIKTPRPGPGVELPRDPAFMHRCDCLDNCREDCSCAGTAGQEVRYAAKSQLVQHHVCLWECHDMCGCHHDLCKNRVVGKGIQLRLEVFRTKNGCGWGVRCQDKISAGTFVCDYVGELIPESMVDERGKLGGDEYVFNLDVWLNDRAVHRLKELGLKRGFEWYTAHMDKAQKELDKKKQKTVIRSVERNHDEFEDDVWESDGEGALTVWEDEEGGDTFTGNLEELTREKVSMMSSKMKKGLVCQIISGISAKEQGRRLSIDAKWYGNVARFINHSCDGNLFKQSVHVENQDVRVPRLALFANKDIEAMTELTYDYGYGRGMVQGASLQCLCGAPSCRKKMY